MLKLSPGSRVMVALASIALIGCSSALGPSSTPAPATASPSPLATVSAPAPSASPAPVPTQSQVPTRNPAAGYADLEGWILFEHFGQAPDGSTADFDFDYRMLWLVRADGSDLHELAPGEPSVGKSSPDISSDGRMVAFNSWYPAVLYQVPIEGGTPEKLSTECDGLPSGCMEVDPAYSADGERLAFVRMDGTESSVVGILEIASGNVEWLEQTRTPLATGFATQPSWAPSGDEIVYYHISVTEDQEWPTDSRALVASTTGSELRELPRPAGAWAADPDWSPDGSLIVFSTSPNRESEGWSDGPVGRIYTVRPDGTGLTQLCPECPDVGFAPSWTSDGRIMFWGYRSWALMNADGSDMAHINQPRLTWFAGSLGYGYAGFLQPTN